MSEMKNDPSGLYDEEFLKKKEEFFKTIDGMQGSKDKYTLEDDSEGFEAIVDSNDNENNKSKKSKKASDYDTPEPEYDIFDLEKFGNEDERFSKKGLKKKIKKDSKEKKAEKKKAKMEKAASKKKAEAEPVFVNSKPFVAHKPVEKVEAEVYQRDEELYKDPSVDIDELLKNLGIVSGEENKASENTVEVKEDISSVAENKGEVKVYQKNEDEASAPETQVSNSETAEKQSEEELSYTRNFKFSPKKETEAQLGFTRHFNLKAYLKNAGKNSSDSNKKKNIRKGFKILDNKTSDETILEAKPTGDGKDSMMDSLDARQGEDIFEAVEKAQQDTADAQNDIKYRLTLLQEYKEKLDKKVSGDKKKLIVLSSIGLVSLILTLLENFYNEGNALEFIFGHGAAVYAIVNLLIFVAVTAVAKNEIFVGIKGIRYLNPDRNSVMVVIGIFMLLYDITTLFMGTMGVATASYTLCFVFAAFLRYMSIFMEDYSALSAAKVIITGGGECEGIHLVDNRIDALSMAHGLSEDKAPSILYNAYSKSDSFVKEQELPRKNEEKFYSIACMVVILAAFIFSIGALVSRADINVFLTVLMSGICLCLPVVSDFTSKVLFMTENRKVLPLGGYINDHASIDEIGKANAIICDASDIFNCEVTRFRRVPGATISKSDSAVFAATALKAGGSMLGECFDGFIESLGIELPEAEDFQYEEKLGFSCWVIGRRVLVGNRQMLVQHSINAPSAEEEKAYAGKKFVMYVAVESELVATFTVQYKSKKHFRRIASEFNKTGVVLLLNSKEPCLDENSSASRLSVEVATVKLVSNKALGVIDSYRRYPSKGRGTSLICLKNKKGILPLAIATHNFYNISKTAGIIHIAGQVLALILSLVAVIMNISLFNNPVAIIVFHILWSTIAIFAVSGYSRAYVKRLLDKLFKKGGKTK